MSKLARKASSEIVIKDRQIFQKAVYSGEYTLTLGDLRKLIDTTHDYPDDATLIAGYGPHNYKVEDLRMMQATHVVEVK